MIQYSYLKSKKNTITKKQAITKYIIMKTVLPTMRLQELSLEMFNDDLTRLNYEQKAKVKDRFLAELLLSNKPITIEVI